MKKTKIDFPADDFGTLNTKYDSGSDKVGNGDFTNGTKNIETSVNGEITKRRGGTLYSTLPNPPRDQYEAIFSDGVRHLLTVDNGNLRYTSGDGNHTLVYGSLSPNLNCEFATTQDRVYFGNGIQTKVYDKVTTYGGVTYTFPTQTVKDMGAQAPASAPTLNVQQASGGVPIGVHRYKVTFVYYGGQESNGSNASANITVTGGTDNKVVLNIPQGGYGVTQRKIYRDFNADAQYVLVGVVTDNLLASTFTDTNLSGLTPIPDDQGLPPDFTLITLYLDKLFVAGVGGDPYTIFYSDTGLPDVFPDLNYLDCNQEDPITALVVYQDRLIVLNRRSMGQILGKTSDQFRYAPIQSSVGCVDTRSVQIRVIDGVPVLVWLSDKGFYAYNGNSVIYISDTIEDQVNGNIQQAIVQKNRVSQSDFAAFSAGTYTDGINVDSIPGSITTKGPYWDTIAHPGATLEEQTNPIKIFDSATEWEDGTTKENISIVGSTLRAPIRFFPTLESGEINGLEIVDNKLQLPTVIQWDSENFPENDQLVVTTGPTTADTSLPSYAYPIIIPSPGVLLTTRIVGGMGTTFTEVCRTKVWADAAGSPGTVLYTGPDRNFLGRYQQVITNMNLHLNPGKYWIGLEQIHSLGGNTRRLDVLYLNNFSGGPMKRSISGGPWATVSPTATVLSPTFTNYNFQQDHIPHSGTWTSQIYDSLSNSITPNVTVYGDAEYPFVLRNDVQSILTSTITVQGSDDPFMVSGVIQEDVNNIDIFNIQPWAVTSLFGKRYWRLIVRLDSSDLRDTPTIQDIHLRFEGQALWESETLDTTGDVSIYQYLTSIFSALDGTSVSTEIATSASPSGPWTGSGNGDGQFGPFGSHIVRQYVKLRLKLFNEGSNEFTPIVNSLSFGWTIGNGTTAAEFISSAIDTGLSPSGWDIFQSSFDTNGGSVSYSMRSASTSGGLTAATWYPVTNGQFPPNTLPVLQWVQWKAILQANPNQVPEIESVTIGWFVGTDFESVRAASIFYDKNYYVALSEVEEPYNNVVYVLDFTGKWRIFKDLNVATMSYFFNSPYYGDAANGNIVKFLEGTQDVTTPIELDVRTKAFDGSTQYVDNDDKTKVLDHVIVGVTNTGASYSVSYSTDGGETYYPLYDTSGNSTWTTGTDGMGVFKYLRPRYTTTIPYGYSLMFRIHSNDVHQCEIGSLKAEAFVREHPPIITG